MTGVNASTLIMFKIIVVIPKFSIYIRRCVPNGTKNRVICKNIRMEDVFLELIASCVMDGKN
jgi:hypothetical protein